ncbi:hypothetical protein [Paenibacillus sp. NFR01]|uniref:hypothetical protein n=1 Tax=Paenibacillus sp. NFR01 TaxID=1566279 RepID=UPI0008C2E59A|nr:hypothetical protein [Paenibacillus sp. NFR01]SET66657.1 hypothetical protein SAMN03159358_2342 [Paenibacillus sp. NFR01]
MRKNRGYRIVGSVLGFMLIALLLYRCGLGLRETSECYLGESEYFSILQWNGVIFGEDTRSSETANLPKGEAVGHIKYTKADHKCPRKTLRNGDATVLEVGTTLYRVEGYKETARLWAGDRLFLANSNPQAETVNDLLDIAGKINTVRFISGMDGKPLKDFTPESAAIFIEEYPKLKNMTYDEISKLPKGTVGYDYWLQLGLDDGTAITLTYSPMRKAFHPGGLATPALAELVEQQRKRIYAP